MITIKDEPLISCCKCDSSVCVHFGYSMCSAGWMSRFFTLALDNLGNRYLKILVITVQFKAVLHNATHVLLCNMSMQKTSIQLQSHSEKLSLNLYSLPEKFQKDKFKNRGRQSYEFTKIHTIDQMVGIERLTLWIGLNRRKRYKIIEAFARITRKKWAEQLKLHKTKQLQIYQMHTMMQRICAKHNSTPIRHGHSA